jgi:hypothetical protein
MSYTAEISRANPACFLFLVDQSGSMSDPWEAGKKKAESLADAINKLLYNITITCAKPEGVRNYYEVGLIGYGGRGVNPAFSGTLANKELVPISVVAESPSKIEERKKLVDDGAGDLIEQKVRFPIWLEPVADGGTPMCEAFKKVHAILDNWVQAHPNSFPPIVIHLTDGESTDGDPSSLAESLQSLSTNDGNVLLLNAHISSHKGSVLFPDKDVELPDKYAKLLFKISSVLPSHMREAAQSLGIPIEEYSRGFVFNAELVDIIKFLKVGTQPSNLR